MTAVWLFVCLNDVTHTYVQNAYSNQTQVKFQKLQVKKKTKIVSDDYTCVTKKLLIKTVESKSLFQKRLRSRHSSVNIVWLASQFLYIKWVAKFWTSIGWVWIESRFFSVFLLIWLVKMSKNKQIVSILCVNKIRITLIFQLNCISKTHCKTSW